MTAAVRFIERIPDSKPLRAWLPALCTAVVRLPAELPERLALACRRLFEPPKSHEKVPWGIRMGVYGGRAANRLARLANGSFARENPLRTDYDRLLAEKEQEWDAAGHQIGRSMSFGLILLAAGLLAVLLFLLLQ